MHHSTNNIAAITPAITPAITTAQTTPPTAYSLAKSSVAWCAYAVDILTAHGADRTDLLQRMTTNEMKPLATSTNTKSNTGDENRANIGIQTVFVNDKARIVDVTTVVALEHTHRIICSSGMADTLSAWLEKYTFIDDFRTTNDTPNIASFLVFGPRSLQLLNECTGVDLRELRVHHAANVSLQTAQNHGCEAMIVKQPTLCDFCWLVIVEAAQAEQFRALMRSFNEEGSGRVGEGVGDGTYDSERVGEVDAATFDTLRIEAAWSKLGNEWTDANNPLEAGLVTAVSFTKGCYIGQEVIARLDTYNKVKVRLVGFTSSNAIPAESTFWDEADGKRTAIGSVTSSAYSPDLQMHIALGYIRSQFANPGASVEATFGETVQQVHIVKLPFVL
jgi:tRNA-modifying protein YgfZ